MKIQSMMIAAAIALVPATGALAVDKEALKKAKEEAKAKAIEKAKEKSEAKTEKVTEQKKAKAAEAAEAAKAAAEEERKLHAKNTGMIERLEQIATATNNAELTAAVARLKEKEAKRHSLAAPAAG
jgi:hypothetical protein